MNSTPIRYVACILGASGLVFSAASGADEQTDMQQRVLECAETTASDNMGECLAAKGAPAVSADESGAAINAAGAKCMDMGVTGTEAIAACINTRFDETDTRPADATEAQVQKAAKLCAEYYAETQDIVVCTQTVLRHRPVPTLD